MTPDQIKALRKTRDWNQQQFAAALGVDQATVSRLESGASEPRGPVKVLLERMIEEAAVTAAEGSVSERAA